MNGKDKRQVFVCIKKWSLLTGIFGETYKLAERA